ncbi:PulJ/GspJ family protein [Stomatohabitans albus]|uniref:PulJ/GspJ family protein n=1 Tax=Stomatohabitans albus TaxID=3110766 RepID=UPI00300C86E4
MSRLTSSTGAPSVHKLRSQQSPQGINQPEIADRGFTLVELLVVIAITSIVGVLVFTSFITVGNIYTRIAEHAEDSAGAKYALDVISTNIRGATVNPDRPDDPHLAIANASEIKFLTYGSSGFGQAPHWVHYRARKGVLYQVDPDTGKEHVIYSNLLPGYYIFRYYKWDYDFDPKNPYGNCFASLTNKELQTVEGRKSIVGLQVQLYSKGKDNVRSKQARHAGAWVRLMEQIQPNDPVTGERTTNWKNTCWETQYGRVR